MRKALVLAVVLGLGGLNGFAEELTPELRAMLDTPQQIKVPRMTQVPVIDGKIGADEWREAIGLAGLHSVQSALSPRQAVFWFGFDGTNVYTAMRVKMRAGEIPTYRTRKHDRVTVVEDSLEMRLVPPKATQSASDQEIGPYLFIANVRGAITDALEAKLIGQVFNNWSPKTVSASTFQNGVWELEFSTDIRTMLKKGYVPGDVWGLMMACNFHHPWNQAALQRTFLKTLDLGLDGSPVAVQMGAVDSLMQGGNELPLSIVNLTAKPQEALLRVLVTREARPDPKKPAEVTVLKSLAQKVSLAPAQAFAFKSLPYDPTFRMEVDKEAQVQAEKTGGKAEARKVYDPYVVEIMVSDTAGKDVYYRRRLDVQPLWNTDELKYTAAPRAFAYDVRYYKTQGKLRLDVDSFTLPRRGEATGARMALKDAAGRTVLALQTPAFDDYFTSAASNIVLKAGAYTADIVITDKSGQPIAQDTYTCEVKDYPWETCLAGTSDQRLPWFTPCRYDRTTSTLACWNREYRMGANGLPAQIVQNTDPSRLPRVWGGWTQTGVLTGPVRIEGTLNGQACRSDTTGGGGFAVREQNEVRVQGQGTFEMGGVRFAVDTWFECDGMLKLAITYGPAAKDKPVAMDSLRLVIPYAWDAVPWITLPKITSTHVARRLADRSGVQWASSEPETQLPMTVGSFVPSVWVGTLENGVLFFGDNDKGWVPSGKVPAVQVVGSEDRTTRAFVLNLVGEPFQLGSDRTVVFALEATPGRPFPPPGKGSRPEYRQRQWTMVNVVKSGRGATENAPRTVDCVDYDKWSQFASTPYVHGGKPPYGVDLARGSLNDHCAIHIETGSKAEIPFGYPDWETAIFPESYRRFTAFHMSKWLSIPYGIDAYYFDCVAAPFGDDVDAGMGYVMDDGRVQPGFGLFALREFFKRCALVPWELGRPSCNTFHTSAPHQWIHLFPFVEERIEGEHIPCPIPEKGPAPVIRYLGEKMMLYHSLAWGMPVFQLNNMWHAAVPDKDDRFETNQAELAMWGITSVGGTIPGGVFTDEPFSTFPPAMTRTMDPAVEWEVIPPWRTSRWFRHTDPALQITAWRSARRLIFYVANWGEKDLSAILAPDWRGLGYNLDGEWEIQHLTRFTLAGAKGQGGRDPNLGVREVTGPNGVTLNLRLPPSRMEAYVFIQKAWPLGRPQDGAPYAVSGAKAVEPMPKEQGR